MSVIFLQILNQDDAVRYMCEAREDGQRILRTYEHLLAEKDNELAEMEAKIASLEAQLRQKE